MSTRRGVSFAQFRSLNAVHCRSLLTYRARSFMGLMMLDESMIARLADSKNSEKRGSLRSSGCLHQSTTGISGTINGRTAPGSKDALSLPTRNTICSQQTWRRPPGWKWHKAVTHACKSCCFWVLSRIIIMLRAGCSMETSAIIAVISSRALSPLAKTRRLRTQARITACWLSFWLFSAISFQRLRRSFSRAVTVAGTNSSVIAISLIP